MLNGFLEPAGMVHGTGETIAECLLETANQIRRCSLALNKKRKGFPGGAVVESPPANAGHTGSCPGLGRFHMPRSGWAREPRPLGLRIRSLRSATGEATAVRGPCTAINK